MSRPHSDIFKVAALVGVALPPLKLRHADHGRDRRCFCRGLLQTIGREHGEGHLALVLRLIVETRGNSGQLYAETIWGISILLARHPFLVDQGCALFDKFDFIDLATVRRRAHILTGSRYMPRLAADAIAIMLAIELLEKQEAA